MAFRKINGSYPLEYDSLFEECEYLSELYEMFDLHNPKDISALYISDEKMEEQLKRAVFNDRGSFIALIGKRGTGKTMLLQHCLQMFGNSVRIDQETCIQLCTFRGFELGQSEEFPIWEYLAAISDRLETEFPGLHDYMHSDQGMEAFFDFIEKIHPELLQCENAKLLFANSKEKRLRLQAAYKHKPGEYEVLRLRFLLSNPQCSVNRLVICLDDLDGLTEACRNKLIVAYRKAHIRFCAPTDMISKYSTINVLSAISPDHYLELSKEHVIANHPFHYEILKNGNINLEKLLSKQIKILTAQRKIKNIDQYKQFQQLFARLSQKFNKKFDRMVKNLCFYDIRSCMELYIRILSNRRWVLQGKDISECGKFNPEDYIINNITVARALSCGENGMYINHRGNLMPNVLYNTFERNYSIPGLYLLGFFARPEEDSQALRSMSAERVVQMFFDIFHGTSDAVLNIKEDIQKVISYFLEKKILERDIRYPQEIHITSRGLELWNMLQADSVLLEMFREDYYREYESKGCENNPYCSELLMQTNQQLEIFKDLCRMLCELIKKEQEFIDAAKKNDMISILHKSFGGKMICFYLLEGVRRSMDYSGLSRNDDVSEGFQQALGMINTI